MSQHLLILGAGTAGTMMANHLRRRLSKKDWRITVVDRSDKHLYQPGLLFLPFGTYTEDQIIRETREFIPPGVDFVQAEIDRIEPARRLVALANGIEINYDLLIIATGCRTAPEETEGMLGPKWRVNIHEFLHPRRGPGPAKAACRLPGRTGRYSPQRGAGEMSRCSA